MKNKIVSKIVFGVCTLLVTNFSYAQEEAQKVAEVTAEPAGSLSVIPVLGGTTMNLSGLESSNSMSSAGTSSKSGSMIGVLAGYKLDWKDATLEAGILLLETGSQKEFLFVGTEETTISYLALPINLRIPFWEAYGMPIHAKVGLIPSFLMSAKNEFNFNGIFGTGTSGSQDIKSNLNGFDAIAQVGVGGTYSIDQKYRVQADMAYLRGLTEVVKDGGGYNQGLSVTVALAISI